MTNYERIKSMSVEEMAKLMTEIQVDAIMAEGWINNLEFPSGYNNFRRWLERECDT